MTTVIEPPVGPPLVSGAHVSEPLSTITADLMPDEILVGRRVAFLKRRLAVVMVGLVALVVLGDALAREQTSSARSDLSAANDRTASLTRQSEGFSTLLTTKADTQSIRTQLAGAMVDDVSWTALLNKLARPAPAGLQLTAVAAQLPGPNAADGAGDATNTAPITSAQPIIGTMTLSGVARSWASVATYVSGLSAINGITAVNPSTVSAVAGTPGVSAHSMIFTITLSLTKAVLSNRYAAAPSASQGATAAPDARTTTPAAAVNAVPAPSTARPRPATHSPVVKPHAEGHSTRHVSKKRSRVSRGSQEAN
ncbi:PilN domain-containing protein [uncultured Jatrophihabitans sp.]|uniref:PilN domain-containing protein n=1 Tax=uncultured Jatrophihabitans sp. TaxID=1610747 RepID=UPI0035CA4A57